MEKLIEELWTCTATLSRIADTLSKTEEPPEKAAPTLEEVRTVLAGLSRNGFTADVRELLKKHGADRLSEVNPAEYAAILKEAESLGK